MEAEDPAKERAANLILMVGLAFDAALPLVALWPGLPADADLSDRLPLVPQPVAWGLYAATGAFLLVHLHYLARFVWGQGQWPVHGQELWELHGSYATALLLVGAVAAAITLFLLPM